MAYVGFRSWDDVLTYAGTHAVMWYQAPLDRVATMVDVVRVYKNGKLRLDPYSTDADAFTADAGHLDRMRRTSDPCPLCGEDREHPSQAIRGGHNCSRR